MDSINEAYKTSKQLSLLREAGGQEDKVVIDMIKDFRSGTAAQYGGPGSVSDFVDEMGLTGSSSFRAGPVKKAKSYLSKVYSGLVSYLKDSFAYYAKKKGETFTGYEGLMLALDMQGNKAVFTNSDFDLKSAREWGADRVVVSLMYGGDRLKAFEKYGNIPRGGWKKLLLKHSTSLEDYGVIEWLATEVGMPETSEPSKILGAAILKYKL